MNQSFDWLERSLKNGEKKVVPAERLRRKVRNMNALVRAREEAVQQGLSKHLAPYLVPLTVRDLQASYPDQRVKFLIPGSGPILGLMRQLSDGWRLVEQNRTDKSRVKPYTRGYFKVPMASVDESGVFYNSHDCLLTSDIEQAIALAHYQGEVYRQHSATFQRYGFAGFVDGGTAGPEPQYEPFDQTMADLGVAS